MKTRTLTLFSALLTFGCSPALTVEQHRAKADQDLVAATADEQQYDPRASAQSVMPGPAMAGKGPFETQPGEVLPRYSTYNPTAIHLDDADAHRHAAASHLTAAKELEGFEDAACTGVSQAARAGCPLLSPKIAQVEEIAAGVRLHLKAGVDAADLAKSMSCHLAFARAHGYDAPSCPLYMSGVSLRSEPGVIELRSLSPATAAALRTQARAMFTAGTGAPISLNDR